MRRRTIVQQQLAEGVVHGAEEKREVEQAHGAVEAEAVLVESAGKRPTLHARWPRKAELKRK